MGKKIKRCCTKNCKEKIFMKSRCKIHYRMFLKCRKTAILKKENKSLKKELTKFKDQWICDICYDRYKTVAFQCGHRTCSTCSVKIDKCPFCKDDIFLKIDLY